VERAHALPDEAEEAVHRARELREALHDIFSAVVNGKTAPPHVVDALNTSLHDAAVHSRLVQRDGPWELRFNDVTSSFNAMLKPIVRAAGNLLISGEVELVRTCSSPTCQWFFLDTSKNHHRRWCSMKLCGNRAKVRKFYTRKKKAE